MLNEKELEALSKTISDPDDKYYKGVLYGDYGKRKTSTALRCMERRATLIHADRGWNIVRNHPDEFVLGENVLPIRYEGLSQIRGLVDATLNGQGPFADSDLFILDTISQMQENYLDFLGENFTFFGRDKAVPTPEALKKDRSLKEVSIVGMPDYHLTRNKMRPIVELLVAAPIDVLFLAHVREPNMNDKAAGKLARRPNVTEAVFNLLARDATFIGYMEAKKDTFTTTFKPTATVCAKSQIKSLTDKTIESNELPNYLKEWKK